MSARLPIDVELADPAFDDDGLPAAIGAELADLGASLGVPIDPDVTVRVADAASPEADPPLRLLVDGRPVRYRAGLPRQVRAAAQLCRHACARQPGVLFGPAQAHVMLAALSERNVAVPGRDWLREVIAGVLDLGIAVGDLAAVAEVLTRREGDDIPPVREALVSRLASDALVLLAPEAEAARLSTADEGLGSDLLHAITSLLSQETGIALPPVRIAAPDGLPAGTFALRVNDVTLPPAPLPAAGSVLVNGSADLIGGYCPGAALTDTAMPGTDRAACVTGAEHRPALDAAGFTTWDADGQIALVVATHVRERIGWLIHQDRLQAQLDAVQELAPRTVLAARTACPPWQLTELVRGLAADRIPLIDLPGLLERLIEASYLDLPDARLALLGDPVTAIGAYPVTGARAERLVTFVRTGLGRTIAQARLGSQEILDVVLLDQATERGLRDGGTSPDRLLDGIATWVRRWPVNADVPPLLVGDDVRAGVADLLCIVHPAVRVLGYGDLPAEVLVAPNSRVGKAG